MTATVPAARRGVRFRYNAPSLAAVIWALLFFNGLAYTTDNPPLLQIPGSAAKAITQGALALALLLVLVLNRARVVRPNLFLSLVSLGAGAALLTSIRVSSGFGSLAREGRLCAFLAVLWLLTPWWGRPDWAVCRWHLQCLAAVCGVVVVGFAISPGGATQLNGRLGGYIWPIPATQVGHYSAVMVGIVAVLWMAGLLRRRTALLLGAGGFVILLLTQTRTAMLGLVIGLAGAMLCLFVTHARVRRVAMILLIAVPLGIALFAPAASDWFDRGQSSQEIGNLTGRTKVWDRIVAEPRPTLDRWLGSGLSNKSFDGLAIDSSWLSIYVDEGLIGDVIVGLTLVSLLVLAMIRPRGPATALAIFLLLYCAIASLTETGLGDVSPYMLDLTVAASLLAAPVTRLLERSS